MFPAVTRQGTSIGSKMLRSNNCPKTHPECGHIP